jgi:methylated-DNA-[protein]-cysteine S-methyltransferase
VIYRFLESPVGRLLIARDVAGIRLIQFVRPVGPTHDAGLAEGGAHLEWQRQDDGFDDIATQLTEYFEGSRRAFHLQLAPEGTPFQLRVWHALDDIPYGETISYGRLACRIGRHSASRAVGLANGSNPLPIVIPCHRVIGANGNLTGYGGGLPIKQWLLALEGGARWLPS